MFPLLDLLERFPDLFAQEVLQHLDRIDRTFLAQAWRACRASVAASDLPRAGTRRKLLGRSVWVVTHKLREFCTSVERLAWAKASGCPWEVRTCVHVAMGGSLKALQWAHAHGYPWDERTSGYGGVADCERGKRQLRQPDSLLYGALRRRPTWAPGCGGATDRYPRVGCQSGATPLFIAAHHGHLDVVELLLSVPGVVVKLADHSGATPLYVATQIVGHRQYMDVVDRLLSVPGVNVNTALTGTGLTPLLYAALHGRLDVVERLLAAPGVDVNLACRVGVTSLGAAITPLAAALVRGHADVAQMLREAGAAKPHG